MYSQSKKVNIFLTYIHPNIHPSIQTQPISKTKTKEVWQMLRCSCSIWKFKCRAKWDKEKKDIIKNWKLQRSDKMLRSSCSIRKFKWRENEKEKKEWHFIKKRNPKRSDKKKQLQHKWVGIPLLSSYQSYWRFEHTQRESTFYQS